MNIIIYYSLYHINTTSEYFYFMFVYVSIKSHGYNAKLHMQRKRMFCLYDINNSAMWMDIIKTCT